MRGRNKKLRHYANYFVAVNVTDAEDGVNETLALHHLPRSGWSFGRAGLGAKATYPA